MGERRVERRQGKPAGRVAMAINRRALSAGRGDLFPSFNPWGTQVAGQWAQVGW